jgi:Putative polyhydroxyalkanoic acid system protein (PHA_gran_rgn)
VGLLQFKKSGRQMSKPLVLSISHSLGKEEAVRRLKSGLSSVPATFHHVLAVQEEVWTGDHLQFRVSALGQVASGTIDVADDHVRLTVALPRLLAQLAKKIQPLIRNQGKLMLEKKK